MTIILALASSPETVAGLYRVSTPSCGQRLDVRSMSLEQMLLRHVAKRVKCG